MPPVQPPVTFPAEVPAWVPFIGFFSLGLLLINVFRFNIFLVLAALMVNISMVPLLHEGPRPLIWAFWLIALAELSAGVMKLVYGRSKRASRRRYVG